MTLEELAALAQTGDVAATEQLIDRLDGLIGAEASYVYVDGMTTDDLMQEGRIALLGALRTWNPALPFGPLARVSVRRRFISLIRMATSKTRYPMSKAVILDDDLVRGRHSFDARMELRDLLDRIGTMSPLEQRAIVGVTVGATYDEIGGSHRAIDNAIQRARKKLAA